jgi:hypothetical protein
MEQFMTCLNAKSQSVRLDKSTANVNATKDSKSSGKPGESCTMTYQQGFASPAI